MNWWTRFRRAWFMARLVWRDPDWVGRTITLDQDTFSRVVWGGDGVLIRGFDAYNGGHPGLIQERLDPWQVRAARRFCVFNFADWGGYKDKEREIQGPCTYSL